MSWNSPYGGPPPSYPGPGGADPFAPLHFPDASGSTGGGYAPHQPPFSGGAPLGGSSYGYAPSGGAGPYGGGPYGPPTSGPIPQGYPSQYGGYQTAPASYPGPYGSSGPQQQSQQYQNVPHQQHPSAYQSQQHPSQYQPQPQHPPAFQQQQHPSHYPPQHSQQQPQQQQQRPPQQQQGRGNVMPPPDHRRLSQQPQQQPPPQQQEYRRASPPSQHRDGGRGGRGDGPRKASLGGAHRGPAPAAPMSPKFQGARPPQQRGGRGGSPRGPSRIGTDRPGGRGSPSPQRQQRTSMAGRAPSSPQVEDEPPIEVLLDIDAEFEDCKPTGKTGLSFYSSVLVAAKTLTLTGKKLAEYWVNRYAAIAKGDATAKDGLLRYHQTLKIALDKLIETVRKGAEGLKDEQVTFLNTSVQALQSFVGVLAESTATTSPAITTRKQIQEELDGALQHLQSIIFSAKSLLLAAELLGELKMQALREQSKPARPSHRASTQPKESAAHDEKKKRDDEEERERKQRREAKREKEEKEREKAKEKEKSDREAREKDVAAAAAAREREAAKEKEREREKEKEREEKEREKATKAASAAKPVDPISLKEPEPPKVDKKATTHAAAPSAPAPAPVAAPKPAPQDYSSFQGDTAPAELSGYLLKLGDKGLTRRWSQRWFQQKGKAIYYYKERPKAVGTSRGNTDIVEIHSGWRSKKAVDMDKEDIKPQGHFDILEVQMVMPGAKVKGGYTLDVVVTTGRTYHLQATTVEDQMRWMSGILAWRNYLFSASSNKASEDNMGLPINASMKTKEKVAALENYVQDLESTIKAETDALGMMEKGGATPADTEPKREMLRELQGKKQKALTKLKELDKSGKKPGKAAAAGPADIKRQDAPPPQQKRATDAKLPTTRPPTASQPPAAAAEAGSGKSVEQLEEELKQANDKVKKLTATKSGLEKLVGFYAKDPAAQQKAQQEVKQMQDDIDKLKKQAQDIKALLEQRKAASAAPPAATATAPASQLSGYQARAMFPFMGQTGGELSFNAGDIINLIDYSHDEWWTGELNGREGSFPCSYVETIDGDEEEQHVAAAPAEPEPEPEPTPQAAAHVDYQHHSASSDAVAAVHENATGAQVEVLYDFTPQDDGELECKQGDILDVLDWPDDEWVRARLNGREGVVPASYVQAIETFQAEELPEEGEAGDYYTATALYDFDGQNEQELSFKAGDVITLTDYSDEEWWHGTLNGVEGMFPASYVQTQDE